MADDHSAIIATIVEDYGKDRTRLMDIVRAVQAKFGCVSEDSIGAIAQALGVHRVEVRDMVSFYHFLRRKPKGKATISLSDCVPCRLQGVDAIAAAFEKATGTKFGASDPDAPIGLEYTSCIGMCDQGPAALVDGAVLPGLRPEDAEGVVKAIKADQAKNEEFWRHEHGRAVESNVRQPGPVVLSPFESGTAIRKALSLSPDEVVNEMNKARVRGRGGAGFPLAMKWSFCRKAEGTHYIVCNADEGEPGTFKDRVILTECPDLLFEGMTVAGYALGATEGLMYLRAEYEYLWDHLQNALAKRRRLGLLGENICGREGFNFDIRIQLGAGAYVCGEESSLIESLEGKRGAPRDRPPFPVQVGYLGEPTAVNNVETLCCAARIMEKGADWFSRIGTKDSTGTKLLSVSGDCERPGVYEIEYGMTVEKLLELVGGAGAQAVQMAGPSGQCLAPKDYGRSICFEDLPTGGSVIIFGPQRDVLAHMRQFTEFFVEESCGWCVPCRIGTSLLLKKLNKVLDGKGSKQDLAELKELGETIETMSRCGLGQTAANPVLSTLRNFPALYENLLQDEDFVPVLDFEAAVAVGREAAGR